MGGGEAGSGGSPAHPAPARHVSVLSPYGLVTSGVVLCSVRQRAPAAPLNIELIVPSVSTTRQAVFNEFTAISILLILFVLLFRPV